MKIIIYKQFTLGVEIVDKGTVIRTIALMVALVNQILVLMGKSPLPIDSELLEQLISAIFTIITTIISWSKDKLFSTKKKKKEKK